VTLRSNQLYYFLSGETNVTTFELSTLAGAVVAAAAAASALFAGTSVSTQATHRLDTAAQARLDSLRDSPDIAGALVYQGAVFAQDGTDTTPVFTYERRVVDAAEGTTAAAHVTRTPGGSVVISEEAQFGPGYRFQRFDAINAQIGHSGSAVVSADGRRIDYRLVDNGRVSTASESVDAPVVSGPSLHGFILEHWDQLAPGARLPVRFVVLAKKQTYGFDIRRVVERGPRQRPGTTSFTITPSSIFVRLAIAPLTVTFDDATRNVVRYEGRVPPLREVQGKLEAFDARVDYTMAVASYR
jgi:hypothetical protein